MAKFDFDIKGYDSYIDKLVAELQSRLPKHIGGVGRMMTASGKRLRPGLVMAIAYHSGRDIDSSVIRAAAAVELVHIASLVHDDIMDDGDLRWGIPTIHAKEGPDTALMAGDYLLARACGLAASVGSKAVEIIAEAIMELCEGQAQESFDSNNLNRSVESLNETILGKTSTLFIAACRLGGYLVSLGSTQQDILDEYAKNLGLAYQYLDDVADFSETAQSSGKSVGNDISEGKYTFSVIRSLAGSNREKLQELILQSPDSSVEIFELLKRDRSIDAALNQAEEYRLRSLSELDKLENKQLVDALKPFLSS